MEWGKTGQARQDVRRQPRSRRARIASPVACPHFCWSRFEQVRASLKKLHLLENNSNSKTLTNGSNGMIRDVVDTCKFSTFFINSFFMSYKRGMLFESWKESSYVSSCVTFCKQVFLHAFLVSPGVQMRDVD